MLKKIGIAVVVAIAVILLWAATQPGTFRIQRTAVINAKAEKVFAQINDFHKWGAWSPWEKIDPSMKRDFSGPVSGVGSVYAWEGNGRIGSGRMEITESVPGSKVGINLDFLKPFEAHNRAEFTIEPQGRSVQVTWAMSGPVPYFAKIIHLFFNMDKMVGGQFETGLSNLKAAAEK